MRSSPKNVNSASQPEANNSLKIGLFVTCLVDLYRPNVGFAAVKLLENAGCEVFVPEQQTCCGQPAFNNGNDVDAKEIAKQTILAFESYDYIVAPSGSCAGMLKIHYPQLFETEPEWNKRAQSFADRCYELVSFLTDVLEQDSVDVQFSGTVTYHDSCSCLRELAIKEQPRILLNSVQGLSIDEMKETEVCCGFGGTFCVKYPEISERIVSDKVSNICETNADTLLAADMGCLLNISGRLSRENKAVRAYHVAEVLAGMATGPSIGEGFSGEVIEGSE